MMTLGINVSSVKRHIFVNACQNRGNENHPRSPTDEDKQTQSRNESSDSTGWLAIELVKNRANKVDKQEAMRV